MLRAPMPPSNPVPSAPPLRFKESGKRHNHNTLSERRSPFVDSKVRPIGCHHSGSPPHTDVSYVQSSDGTGGAYFFISKMSLCILYILYYICITLYIVLHCIICYDVKIIFLREQNKCLEVSDIIIITGSSNGRNKGGTLNGKRSPPKQALLDMIPPPPPNAPPSDIQSDTVRLLSSTLVLSIKFVFS